MFQNHLGRPIRSILLAASALLLASCAGRPEKIRLIVPDGYTGLITIDFDEPSGAPLSQNGGVTTLRINPDGHLKIKDSYEKLPTSFVEESITYSGASLGTYETMKRPGDPGWPSDSPRRAFLLTAHNERTLYGFVGSEKDLARDVSARRKLYP